MVKNPSAMQETRIQSLHQEDLLEMEMTTHSSILAWRIPWTEEPGALHFMGSKRVGHDLATEQSRYNEEVKSYSAPQSASLQVL